MSVEFLKTRAFKYELSIEINAPPPEVWTALIEETDAWWLPDFHMLGTGSTVTLRAEAGGALIETHADGGSLLWYTVQMVSPGESLHLAGHLAPEWGGPATTLLSLVVRERDGGTTLILRDALFGAISEETIDQLRGGWTQLLGEGLRQHLEQT